MIEHFTTEDTEKNPNINPEIDALAELLGRSLLASYLLGQDQVNDLAQRAKSKGQSAEFAEPGDEPKKKKSKRPSSVSSVVDARFDVPPTEAIDYFKRKKIVSKKVFNQLEGEARSGAFTVSRVYKEDVLRGFKDEIQTALESGATQQQTIKRFKAILAGDESQEMLGDYHLETVFRANMGTAYGVGRRQGMESVLDDLPFWEYRGALDDRERPSHRALEGITLPADNPFWNTHYPPWEWGCRCQALPTDEIPDGYDPKNPSGRLNEYGDPEVDISYNDDGSPAKAEIGTSLIDLMVSKSPMSFRGVPPQGNLRQVIEEGARRAAENRKQKADGSRQKEGQ